MRTRYRVIIASSLCAGILLVLLSSGSLQEQAQAGSAMDLIPQTLPGQSATLLPDGRYLILGGEESEGPADRAAIWDPRRNVTALLETGLNVPRAFHTATLLPNGTILVLGGLGADAQIVSAPELFEPDSATFELLPSIPLTPRAHHTATVLTDGRLLVVGGLLAGGETTSLAELWDFRTNLSETLPVSLLTARRGHSASLLPDGNVLFRGGVDASGNELDYGELFDPETQQFTIETFFPQGGSDRTPPRLEASIPDDRAVDVPVDSLIALRFSKLLRVETVTPNTVILEDPEGAVEAKVIPAEGGIVAFITPASPLLPGTTYTVSLDGSVDQNGGSIHPTTVSFTTAGTNPNAFDDEEWIPSPDDNWRTGRPKSPWESMPPLQAAEGVTALAGQVLKLNGKPLQNVTLEMHGGYVTRTDNTGRFLLQSIPPGHHSLWIKGHTANSPGKSYGIFAPGVDITEGKTNVLPYTIWMPRIDTAHAVTIPSPTTSAMVITTPRLRGLELHLPPKTVIRDHHGNVATEISITPIPLDRPPFPLPRGVDVPLYFTIQPGGAYIHSYGGTGRQGARLIYPNVDRRPPGANFEFWNYDPYERGWHIYGEGTVSADGRQVIPDPGVEIYEFTGAMVGPPSMGPPTWPEPEEPDEECQSDKDGDPVDCSTGIFIHSKTDLFLPDVLPIQFTRTYRPGDSRSRPFGIGATHSLEIFNVGDANPWTFQEVILPDGGRLHYDRISPGSEWTGAVYEHISTPTRFYGSQISWNGNGWDLTLKDGTVYVFPDSANETTPEKAAILAIRDRYGNTITMTRDSNGLLKKITSPNGRWIDFTHDSSNRITLARDNIGRTVTYEYDVGGRLWKVTDPNGGVTEYTYDSLNRMLTIKNPLGIVQVTNEYDSDDRVTKQTLANGKTYLFDYTLDAGGNITQTDVTDPRGNVRRIAFASSGYTTSNTYGVGTPEEQTIALERGAGTNLMSAVVDALGRRTEYTYDSVGNLTSFTRLAGTPDAVVTSFTYEPAFNQLATITDPLNHTTTREYDASGNVTSITDPTNKSTTFAYDSSGRPVSITDALGNATQLGYAYGDLASVTDPLGRTTTRFVDSGGRLISITDSLENSTRSEYDALNRLKKLVDPKEGETQVTYDSNGNTLSISDARSNATTYTYDDMDRIETRTDPLLIVETYEYDEIGNTVRFTDRRGKVTQFDYDALNRMVFAGYGWDGSSYASTISYTYDAGDRLIQVVDSTSGTITRTYNDLDRLTSETTPQGTVSYTYDDGDRRTTMTVPNQPGVNYTYDEADRVTQIAQGASTVLMDYDTLGRQTTLTLPNGVITSYGYNSASQLASIMYSLGQTELGNLTYAYDAAGRRTHMGGTFARTNLPQAVGSATYDVANQLTQWGATSLTHDANGNLNSDGINNYTWDARNQLVSIAGGNTASFQYDAFDRRSSKTVNGTSTTFLYDGVNPVQEENGGGQTTTLLTGLKVDEFFIRSGVTASEFFLTDGLINTVALSDVNGEVSTEYTFEPFGKTTVSGATTTNALQFTARENDGTGLHYYRARYYSPNFQRFVAQDPLGVDGGINLYAYVGNNPIRFIDPFGLAPTPNGKRNNTTPLMCKNSSPGIGIPRRPTSGSEPDCEGDFRQCIRNTEEQAFVCVRNVGAFGAIALSTCLIGCGGTGPGYPACVLTCATAVGEIVEAALAFCALQAGRNTLRCQATLILCRRRR